jgi:hypothetical protein
MGMTYHIELTERQRDALLDGTDALVKDQTGYLDSGDLEIDYGNEWREACERKANLLDGLAEIAVKLYADGLAAQARDLADRFKVRAEEED